MIFMRLIIVIITSVMDYDIINNDYQDNNSINSENNWKDNKNNVDD